MLYVVGSLNSDLSSYDRVRSLFEYEQEDVDAMTNRLAAILSTFTQYSSQFLSLQLPAAAFSSLTAPKYDPSTVSTETLESHQ